MTSPARVTAVGEYAEISPCPGTRVTAISDYAEIDPGDGIRATALLGYTEVDAGDGIYATGVLMYLELGLYIGPPASVFWIAGCVPPWYAGPDRLHPPLVKYPEPKAKYGGGRPARAIGLPSAEVGREWISQQGLDWWMSLFTSTSEPYIATSVSLYDPLSNGWRTGSGYVWKPEYRPAENMYTDFRVKITGLEFWE